MGYLKFDFILAGLCFVAFMVWALTERSAA
ncbi:hypothetical protein MOMMJLID_CDS0037 [Arthrobacter phage 1191A]|nr:hypothetical protein MOMMJLID_CDS0037 [Arthrobacter phage 1191A]